MRAGEARVPAPWRDHPMKRVSVESTAEAYLELLAARGVEYFFGNAGTDFAPLIEAYAKRISQGQHLPRPLTIPHETIAVGMAHGYAMVTGRPQVVMVHVIVGAANALVGIINAARCHVPMLFTAGRNPLTEFGMRGSRTPPDPLGAGVVRPGRHDARVGEVGLRAPQLRPARDGGGPRARHHPGRAAGPGVPDAAARGPGRAPGAPRVRRGEPGAPARRDGLRPGRRRSAPRASSRKRAIR